MVKNLENVSGKFLMYQRFVQVFLEKQLEGMSNHKRIYVTPFHTKKIFRNMRRVEKGFSRKETPLFLAMMVQAQKEMGEGSAINTDPHLHKLPFQLSTSQPQKKQKPRKPKRKDTEVPQPSSPINNVTNEAVYEEMNDSLERAATTATSLDAYTHFDADTYMFEVHDLVGDEVVVETKVASKDVNLSVDKVTLSQALAALKSAKPKADKVMLQESEQGIITTTTAATIVTAASTRPKAKGLVIHEQEQAPTSTVSSQEPSQLNVQDKGKDKKVKPEPVKKLLKKDQLMLDEELAFKLQAEKEEERLARKKAQQIEEANIVSWDNVSKRAGTELEQESVKKQKVDEDKETAELQRLTKIIPDKEKVAIDAIPLATKPPSIVDYKIHKEGKKTYYQIIRVDGSSKMYLVFSHVLKSFDMED
ncbi:hypothetical protein Tco_0449678 [Tanacetum coccineum]